jgi:hypothetical protein
MTPGANGLNFHSSTCWSICFDILPAKLSSVGFEVLIAVVMSSIFWDIMSCSPLKIYGPISQKIALVKLPSVYEILLASIGRMVAATNYGPMQVS